MSTTSYWPPRSIVFLLPVFLSISIAGDAGDASISNYHAQSAEIRVTFFTTDQNDHLVDRVTEDDFAIVDGDSVIRKFRSFARSDETGLDVIAVVDSSESVSPHIEDVKKAVLQMVSEESLVSEDNIAVVAFSGKEPMLLCAHSCNSSPAKQRLRSLKADGPTPLFDALRYAASSFATHHSPNARQIVVLLSDGHDTISKSSAEDALTSILASGALLYVVDINDGRDPQGQTTLQRMAETTGGRFFPMREGAAGALQSALADLRASFTVCYRLPNRVAGFHSLRILPKHNLNLHFHSRRGYLYEEAR